MVATRKVELGSRYREEEAIVAPSVVRFSYGSFSSGSLWKVAPPLGMATDSS